MLIRVTLDPAIEETQIGEYEADILPSVGDTFWYDADGPFVIKERTFHVAQVRALDSPHHVSLIVERVGAPVTAEAVVA